MQMIQLLTNVKQTVVPWYGRAIAGLLTIKSISFIKGL